MKKVLALFVAALLIISSCKDKEKEVAVESVTIDKGAATNLILGETLTLKATVLPDNATSREVTWNSSQPLTATVSGGVVTPLKEGETIISATAGGITAKCTVTVLPKFIPLTRISFNTDKMTLVINNKKTLTPLFTPANASDQAVVWNSDKEDIATVSQSGEIEAKKTGTCKITVKSSKSPSIAATCGVEVVAAPIALTGLKAIPSDTTVEANSSLTLKYRTIPANATNVEVAFESSDVTKATVTETGVVKAKDITTTGSPVIITVKSKDAPSISATCRLTIVTATVRVSSITISPPDAVTLSVGQKKTLEATVMPLNATNRTVTWTSSDEKKATVSNTGEVTAGSALGEVYITASATDGSNVSAAKTVTVKSNDASLTAMTLGAAKHAVTPVEGQTVNLKNVERTFYSTLTAVPVTITAAAGATVKTGTTDVTSEGNVNFTNPVVFTVTAADGVTTKTYTVGIAAYNAASNPYGVYTAAHLHDVRNDKAASYLMKNNITLPERNADGAAATGIGDYAQKGWLPIADNASILGDGTVTEGFAGKFDGGNFSIDNLYINRTSAGIGLFGGVSGATIQNLGVIGVTGTGPAVTGFRYVGALAGAVEGGSITNCYASANISLASNGLGDFLYVGGLLGHSTSAKISKSYSSGKISGNLTGNGNLGTGGFAGGVEGGDVTDCFATGDVTAVATTSAFGGGFAGAFIPTKATNCYATGNVTATAQSASLGGFLGLSGSSSSTYTGCYRNSGAVLTKNGNTAASEEPSSTGITAKTKAEMQHDDFKGLLNDSGSIWGRDANKNDGLPYIQGVGVGK